MRSVRSYAAIVLIGVLAAAGSPPSGWGNASAEISETRSEGPPPRGPVFRFARTGRVKTLITGNTLGLASEINANGPGTAGSIHTFIAAPPSADLVPANPANSWPPGTTGDWTMNESSASLTLPPDVEVVYAELVWGGSYSYGSEDVSANLDDTVTLVTPAGVVPVTPDPQTASTIQDSGGAFPINFYLRSADVTEAVIAGGSGTYAAGQIPGTQSELINSLNALGWTLVVFVRGEELECQSLRFDLVGKFVDEFTDFDVFLAGFDTPSAGQVEGWLMTGAAEGDADQVGDSVFVQDPNSLVFLTLSGLNNPGQNFFASQINRENGVLDSSGDFAEVNHNAQSGQNVSGGRQGWDHTGVLLSSQNGTLANDQSTATLRWSSTGDSYLVTFFALELAAKSRRCGPIFSDRFEA